MPHPYRLLALGVFFAFGATLFGALAGGGVPRRGAAPTLLPAAHANPVEVGFADTLHAGETLSQLLARAELAQAEAQALLAALSEHRDPRRMQPGSVFTYRRAADGGVRAVELRLDADHTLSLARADDGWQGEIEEVPVTADTVVFEGTVESSLYAALLGDSGSAIPAAEREWVVDELADRILAWQLDFSRDLRAGDRFRILHERLVRPDGTARSGRILGVQFRVNGTDHEAYAFTAPDGTEGYYDRAGASLRRAFLRAPLQYRRISSAFNRSRFHPILKVSRPHNGIDYAASAGTPVFAVGDGVVRSAGVAGGYGNLVELSHTRGYSTRYAHLQGFARGIRAGVRVKQGDVIGYVGATGQATGPHLHYEFHANGRPMNPSNLSFVSGDPIPERYRGDFLRTLETHLATLDRATQPVLLADAGRVGEGAAGE